MYLILSLKGHSQWLLDGQEGVSVDVVGQVDVWNGRSEFLFRHWENISLFKL